MDELEFRDQLDQLKIRLDGVIADLDTKRSEYNVLDNILDPFKDIYATKIGSPDKQILNSPIYQDYVEFTTQWIPQKQTELKKIKDTKIKTALKGIKHLNIDLEKEFATFRDNIPNSVYNSFNLVQQKILAENGKTYQDFPADNNREGVNQAWVDRNRIYYDCEQYAPCDKVMKARTAFNNYDESLIYCVYTNQTHHITSDKCNFLEPGRAFVRDRQTKLRDVKNNVKENIQNLINERIQINKEIVDLRSEYRQFLQSLDEREKTDFSFWVKRHITSPNTTEYANMLHSLVATPENKDRMMAENISAMTRLALKAQELLEDKPSRFNQEQYKAWENRFNKSEARFGARYVETKKDGENEIYEIREQLINKDAEWNTKMAITDFLQKSVSKIAVVLDNRPDCNKFSASLDPADLTTFNGIIKTECANGDQFTTKNRLTYVSQYYKPSIDAMVRSYNKYPTTFIDVLHKQKPIPQPSEEWMNGVFVQK